MSSGISSSKAQAGNGYPFVSFRDIFNNTILPENLTELMNTSDQERIKYSVKWLFLSPMTEFFRNFAVFFIDSDDYIQEQHVTKHSYHHQESVDYQLAGFPCHAGPQGHLPP